MILTYASQAPTLRTTPHPAHCLPDPERGSLALVRPIALTDHSDRRLPPQATVTLIRDVPAATAIHGVTARAPRGTQTPVDTERLCVETKQIAAAGMGDNRPRRAPIAIDLIAMPTLPLIGSDRKFGVINNKRGHNRVMPQVEIVPIRLAKKAAELEREAMQLATHPDSPSGALTSDEEMRHIRGVRLLRNQMERYAMAVELSVTVARTGLDSQSTRRNVRELFPEYDDAA